ncbi:unnamed protein product [Diamesa serratosioi]
MSSAKPNQSFKRSIDKIFTVFANLKDQKGQVEKPLKNALYNAGVVVVLAAFVGVILVLLPFIKPLCWAFLFGALLFPAKRNISDGIKSWIDKIEEKQTPIFVGIMLAPIDALENLGKFISCWIFSHFKILGIGFIAIVIMRIIVHYAPKEFIQTIWNIVLWNHTLFGKIAGNLNVTMVIILLISYCGTVYLMWNPSTSNLFMIAGQGLWILISAYICSFFGAFQIPAFVGIMIYGLIGIIYDVKHDNTAEIIDNLKNIIHIQPKPAKETEDTEKPEPVFTFPIPATPMAQRLMATKNHFSEIKSKMQLNVPPMQTSKPQAPDEPLESDVYFKILFYSCTATVLWRHLWIVFLCLIPVIMYTSKALCKALGVTNYFEVQYNHYYQKFMTWLQPRKAALLPICLPGILQLNAMLHKFFCSKLKSYVDDISAIVMILFLIFFVIFLGVFSFFQIYSETIAVAQLGSNLVNRTLIHRPDLVEMLPIDLQSMDSVIDNAYKYGRSTIEEYFDGVFNQTDPVQAKKLKCQILSVWDRLIQSYMDRNNVDLIGPHVTTDSIKMTIDEIVNNSATKAGLIGWVKSNLGMLMEVGDSLWILLRTNLSLLFSAFTTLFGVLLGGGHAMIKFLFHTIIFFTTLYYLLQSSQDRYAPIAININSSWGTRLAEALEDSVSSVLVATLKLSLFHGLFTWLTHTIFGAHVVYLPAVLASVLAAAPFLETYWCSVPAFLDLWLSQDRFYLGLLLVLIHFIVPSNFNPIIHSEIKGGGHPYLTGLSIAGGMYLLGLEGAVLGPLLLCLLVVLFEVTISSLRDSPANTFTRQSSADESNSLLSPAT